MSFTFIETSSAPIKAWINGVDLEDAAKKQLLNVASLPFIHNHIAVMPDVHWGMGATVGSIIATRGAIIPAAVGVDIGCGMMAVKTTLTSHQLPDTLAPLRTMIEQAVPHGRTNNGSLGDRGAWGDLPSQHGARWSKLRARYDVILAKHPKAKPFNTDSHMGHARDWQPLHRDLPGH